MGVQCSLTGSNSEEIPVVFREGKGSQRELFGKDTKLKLEDCLEVRYTRDSRDDPGVGGVFFKYTKNRLAGSRGHMQGGEGGSSHSAVLTAICLLLFVRAYLRTSPEPLPTRPTN